MMEIKPGMRFALTAFFIGMAIAGLLFIGGMASCLNGGGVLSLKGYQCVDIDILTVCEFDGVYYPIPDNSEFNITWSSNSSEGAYE